MTIESQHKADVRPCYFQRCSLVILIHSINPESTLQRPQEQAPPSPSRVGFVLLMTRSTTVTTRETTKNLPRAEDSAPSEKMETKM